MNEIEVKVHQWGEGRAYMLRWTDPVSGKRKTKSAGTTDYGQAERAAAKLEAQLRAGHAARPSAMTWKEFLKRYDTDKLDAGNAETAEAYRVALGHVTRVLNPDRLCKLTTATMTAFVRQLRAEKMTPVTIARHLRHIGAALRWAHRQGYLDVVPALNAPKTAAGMHGRPITGEEFDRMIGDVPKVREQDTGRWERLLRGLWLSGLRISEAVILSWDDGPFQIDLDGRHPAFRIQGAGQKSGRAEMAPMTPDFARWVLETPEADRTGLVFGIAMTAAAAGRVVSKIGERAKVVVLRETKPVKDKAGKWTEREVIKYASAHDLRRAFGTRWAQKVMPAVLQRLMRHSSITTTMKYYVAMDVDEVSAGLWAGESGQVGNTTGNTRSKSGVGSEA